MPRRKKCRFIQSHPDVLYFKPRGIPLRDLDECVLTMDEVEAIRLADLDGRSHEDAASAMGISRPTFGRILASARGSVADALLNGKAIRMQHTSYAVLAAEKQSPKSEGRVAAAPAAKHSLRTLRMRGLL